MISGIHCVSFVDFVRATWLACYFLSMQNQIINKNKETAPRTRRPENCWSLTGTFAFLTRDQNQVNRRRD